MHAVTTTIEGSRMALKKLGRRPTDKTRPVLNMGAHLTNAAFQAPTEIDYASRVENWLLGRNDVFGTCGPTSVANFALLVSTVLSDAPVEFTDDEILDLYRRSGNPDFNPDTGQGDNGVDMTVMLAELVKNGIGEGERNVKAIAFGSVNPHDEAEIWAAGAIFGGALWGAVLDQAQGAQFDAGKPWDYSRYSPLWGGHAILAAPRYTDTTGKVNDRTGLVTWARLVDSTDAFIEKQVEEAYVVIFPWHLTNDGFLAGIDLAGVAQEFEQLTGRPFPANVVPPEPEPTPEPPTPEPPAPEPVPDPVPTPPVPVPVPVPDPEPTPDPVPTPPAPGDDPFPFAALDLALTALIQVLDWLKRNAPTTT